MSTSTLAVQSNTKGGCQGREAEIAKDQSSGVSLPAAGSPQPRCEAHWERMSLYRPAKHAGLCAECLDGIPMHKREMIGVDYTIRKMRGVFAVKPPKPAYRRIVFRNIAAYTAEEIITVAGDLHNMTPEGIRFHSNAPHYSYPRGTAAYLLRNCLGMSFPKIAKTLGGFHHTTMIHAVIGAEARMERDPEYARAMKLLVQKYSARKEFKQ